MSKSISLIETYRQETEELLTDVEEAILDLEQDPENRDTIDRLFRAVHTIKGSGSMFGFNEIADFTHHMETVLDHVREGVLGVTDELITLILSCRDQIKMMLESTEADIASNRDTTDNLIAGLKAYLPRKQNAATKETGHYNDHTMIVEKTYHIRFSPYLELFTNGIDLNMIFNDLNDLGEFNLTTKVDDTFSLDEFGSTSCHLLLDIFLTTDKGIQEIQDAFVFIIDKCDLSIKMIDAEDTISGEELRIKKLCELLVARDEIAAEDIDHILQTYKQTGEFSLESKTVDSRKLISTPSEQEHIKKLQDKVAKSSSRTSIRVPAEKLDSLVDLVGEMVTAQACLSSKALMENDAELMQIAEEIESLVGGLRDNTISIRMLQIGITFSNFKRLVRDLSLELGKKINMTTSGGETELDKTVIERLNDPLIHIIRNCIDHGIESPETRKRLNKPEHGEIQLSAEHSGAHVLIRISDNGAGLDPEAIHAKAVEKGLINPDDILTEKEIFQFIFAPGFSTAKTVTDISGRGVGMDVVKRNIDALRGSIEIDSQKNVGTTITIKLPLTLAIIDGLMVSLGKNKYILPLETVEECVELSQKGADKALKGSRILDVRGEAVPYIRLRDHFGIDKDKPVLEHIVIVEANGHRTGLVVDNVIGGHQTVIKSLGPAFKHQKDVSGATILGDGTVALILDVNQLVQ